MRALILAQGNGRRWQKPDRTYPLGVPKHLIRVDGEALLHRVVRLLSERGVRDIIIIGPDDDRYRNPDAKLVTLDDPFPTGTSMDKLFATEPLWDSDGRTTIFWGDCFYTEEAMDAIVACTSDHPHWFRRPAASTVTGHRWDESFAITFLPEHHQRMLDVAHRVNRTLPANKIHMWNHYAAYIGARMLINHVIDSPHQTHIDDWTDDFDSWAEWCGWMGRYQAGKIDLAVCVPWYGDVDRYRARSQSWTDRYWSDNGVRVVYGTGDSRSAARNDAVRRADADVVLITDADTYVPVEQAWAAAYLAEMSGRLIHAYTKHYRLDSHSSQYVYTSGKAPSMLPRALEDCSSGCIAVSRRLMDRVGGHDERFVGWGSEDRAFQYACEALTGVGERIHGPSFHLYHPIASPGTIDRDEEQQQRNIELAMRYKAASGLEAVPGSRARPVDRRPSPETVLSILSEPGGPLETVRIAAE